MSYHLNLKHYQKITVSAGEGSWTRTFSPEHETGCWIVVDAPNSNDTFDVSIVDEDTGMELWRYPTATGSMGENLNGLPFTGTYTFVVDLASSDGIYELELKNQYRT